MKSDKTKLIEDKYFEYAYAPYKYLILSGGKTGGSSLNHTLGKKGCATIYIHKDSQWKLSQSLGSHLYMNKNYKVKKPISIFELLQDKPIIISIYRNLIDRKISSYFQNLEHNRKYFNVPKNISTEQEVDFFQQFIFHELENYEGIDEALNHYNINKPMEYKGDYWILEDPRATFIRLKFSNISRWNTILSKLLKTEIILIPKNLSQDKTYKSEYELFKKIYFEKYN